MAQRTLKGVGGVAAISLILLALMGCLQVSGQEQSSTLQERVANANTPPTPQRESIAMKQNQAVNPKLVDANTRFGFKLFSEILKQDQGKNVFVSPQVWRSRWIWSTTGPAARLKQQWPRH